jgi:hypothetical protein
VAIGEEQYENNQKILAIIKIMEYEYGIVMLW